MMAKQLGTRMQRTICSFILSSIMMLPLHAAASPIYHSVVFWLKPDVSASQADEIIRSIKSMAALPMVQEVLVGKPVMSDRAIDDDNFSIAFTMIFEDAAALQAYGADPYHKKISSEVTMPYVARGVIYDYQYQE
ncbi:MAG: Dabb family protein [Gammaproteobacteria bacterium]|nr:Dabb family protein [Gammaproteobacteria bacterium]